MPLTVTEFLILQTLALRPGTIKSREAIKHAIHEDQVYVDDRSIDSHVKRIRKKFKDVDSEFDQLETLYGVGYRFKTALSAAGPIGSEVGPVTLWATQSNHRLQPECACKPALSGADWMAPGRNRA